MAEPPRHPVLDIPTPANAPMLDAGWVGLVLWSRHASLPLLDQLRRQRRRARLAFELTVIAFALVGVLAVGLRLIQFRCPDAVAWEPQPAPTTRAGAMTWPGTRPR